MALFVMSSKQAAMLATRPVPSLGFRMGLKNDYRHDCNQQFVPTIIPVMLSGLPLFVLFSGVGYAIGSETPNLQLKTNPLAYYVSARARSGCTARLRIVMHIEAAAQR